MENNKNVKKGPGRKPEKEYTAYYMKKEYGSLYQGEYKYCIYTREITEDELLEKYGAELEKYRPYIIIAGEDFYEAHADLLRNNENYENWQLKHGDMYGFSEGESEIYHPELVKPDVMNEIIFMEYSNELEVAMEQLTPTQRRRVIAHFYDGKSSRTIAKEEGVNYSKVDKSIKAALEKLRKFFE